MTRTIHIASFALLASISFFSNAFELIKTYNFFSSENVDAIHQGLDDKLWLTQNLAFQAVQLGEQNVESINVFRPPFIQGNINARIPHIAETKDVVWFTFENSLYTVPTNLAAMPWEQRNEVLLPEIERDSVFISDLINHFLVVPAENLLFVATREQVAENNQQIAVYQYTNDSIELITSYDSGCPDIFSLHVSHSGFIVRCFSPDVTTYYETFEGTISSSTALENDQVIFLDRDGNYYLYFDPDTSAVIKQSVNDDSLSERVSKTEASLEYFNQRGDFIVSEFDPLGGQLFALYRNDGNGSFTRFKFDDAGPNQGTSFSSNVLFATSEDTLLLNSASFSLEDEIAVLALNDWRDAIGLSVGYNSIFLDNNSIVSVNTHRTQILEYDPSDGLQAITSEQILIEDGTFSLSIDLAEADSDTWWLVAFARRSDQEYTTIKMINRDGSTSMIDMPSPETGFEEVSSSSENLLAYDETSDSLIAWRAFSNFYLVCSDAKNLNETNCEYGSIDTDISFTEYVREGIVVASQSSTENTSTLSYYQITGNALAPQWDFIANQVSRVLHVPGSDYIYSSFEDLNGTNRYATFDLMGTNAGTIVTLNKPVFFDNMTCRWDSVTSASCFEASRVNLLRVDPVSRDVYEILNNNSDSIEFFPLLFGPEDTLVTVGFNEKKINSYRIPEFDLAFSNTPTDIEVIQDIPVSIDAATFMFGDSINNGSLQAELFVDNEPEPESLSTSGGLAWQVLVPNELAKTDPAGKVEFLLEAEGGWSSRFEVLFPIINVNDAPQAIPGANTGEALVVGESYILLLQDLVTDIDDDLLDFTTSSLPSGFVRDGDEITVSPLQAGTFSFSVTATDPGGLSVTVEVTGSIISSTGSQQPGGAGGGGGSTGFSLFALLFLAVTRFMVRATRKNINH